MHPSVDSQLSPKLHRKTTKPLCKHRELPSTPAPLPKQQTTKKKRGRNKPCGAANHPRLNRQHSGSRKLYGEGVVSQDKPREQLETMLHYGPERAVGVERVEQMVPGAK